MDQPPLTIQLEVMPGGLLAIAYSGTAGAGSAGNEHGSQMHEVLRRAVAEHKPSRLLIDLRGLDYRFGDWIGDPVLSAAKELGTGRVCVVASGETWKTLLPLWSLGLVPLMNSIEEGRAYLNAFS